MSVAPKSRKKISKTAKTKALPEKVISLIAQGSKAAMPQHLKPMLCEKREKPFDGENWIYELKLDGYRIIAHLNKGNVALYSREQQNYTSRYTAAVDILRGLKVDALIDGEMVALNEQGQPDFSEIRNYNNGDAPLIYYVFNILWVNGYDLKSLPLIERKNILQQLIPPNDIVKYVDHIEQTGIEFFELVEQQGLEGIIAKEKVAFISLILEVKVGLKS